MTELIDTTQECGSPRDKLQELLQRRENTLCADCNESGPTWASTNWGTFLCTQCAGVHRSLGVEHSFVLSCTLDNWTEAQVKRMAENGNQAVNEFLEFSVPKTIEVPYLSFTDRDTREQFIRAKYVTQLFRKANGKNRRPPERIPRKRSSNSPPTTRHQRSQSAMVEYIGILHIHLIECRDLVIKDLTSSDPYCVLTVGLQSRKTKPKYKTLTPKYDEHYMFSWDGIDKLLVEVYDKDELTKDDHMGKVELDLSPLLQKEGAVLREWYTVRHRKKEGKLQGEMLLEVSFTQIK